MKKYSLVFLFCFLLSNAFAQNNFNVLKDFNTDKSVQRYYQQFLDAKAHAQILGTETGNGGDVVRDFFIHEALKILATLEKQLIFRLYYSQLINPSEFAKKISIQNISVSTKAQLLDNKGSLVDAKVVKEGFKSKHLFLNNQAWLQKIEQYKTKPYLIQRLILHEILRLNSISDDNYIITEQILSHFSNVNLEKLNIAYTVINEQFFKHPNFNLSHLKSVDKALAKSVFSFLSKINLSDRFAELTFLKVQSGKVTEFKPQTGNDLLNNYGLLLLEIKKSLKVVEDTMGGKYKEYRINKKLYPISILSDRLKRIKLNLKRQRSFLEEQFWLKLTKIIKTLRSNDLITKKGFLACEDTYTKGTKVRVILQSLTKDMQSFRVMIVQESTDLYAQVVGDVFKVESFKGKHTYQLLNVTGDKKSSNKQAFLLLNKKGFEKNKYVLAIFESEKWLGHKGVKVWLTCTIQSEGVSFEKFQADSYF